MIERKNRSRRRTAAASTHPRMAFALTRAKRTGKMRRMRIAVHVLCLAFLWSLLLYLWNQQFEPAPGAQTIGLPQLEWLTPPTDHIQYDPNALQISASAKVRHATFGLPFATTSDYLYISISARTKKLIPGKELWQDGRIFVEWLTPENQRATVTPIHSARGDSSASLSFAVKVPSGNVRPVLQMQNLGKQGDYLIQRIELTPAQHTRRWQWGSFLISAASLFLISSLLAKQSPPSWTRRLLATSVLALFSYLFIIPGPWPKRVGIGQPLHWKAPSLTPSLVEEKNLASTPAIIRQSGVTHPPIPQPVASHYSKLPEPDNLALRAKKALKKIRPLLHVALLFFPVLLICYCVGAKRGFLLGTAMALGIEAAQWLFGYGFHADDVWDLLANLCGISLAVFCYLRPWRRDLKSLVSSRHEASL